MSETIYALYLTKDGNKEYFYVGRTSRDPVIRFQEHIYNSQRPDHNEDVYVYIREQGFRCGLPIFDLEVLCECTDDVDDYEDFYVITLIRAGCDLKNMKHGDLKKIAFLKSAASGSYSLSNPKEVRDYRKEYERSEKLKSEVRGTSGNTSPVLLNFIAENNKKLAELRRIDAEKREKKSAATRVREKEYNDWLAQQRHLFAQDKK